MSLRSAFLRHMGSLIAHGANQSQALQRAAVAKAQGLEPEKYGTPFPGSTETTNTTTTTTINNNDRGYIKGALLGAALLTGGAGTTAAVLWPQTKPTEAIAKPIDHATEGRPTEPVKDDPTRPAGPQEWESIKEELQPDGSWKEIGRERFAWEKQADGTWKKVKK